MGVTVASTSAVARVRSTAIASSFAFFSVPLATASVRESSSGMRCGAIVHALRMCGM